MNTKIILKKKILLSYSFQVDLSLLDRVSFRLIIITCQILIVAVYKAITPTKIIIIIFTKILTFNNRKIMTTLLLTIYPMLIIIINKILTKKITNCCLKMI